MRRGHRNKSSQIRTSSAKVKVDQEADLHGMTIDAALRRVRTLLTHSGLAGGTVLRLVHGHSNRGEDSIKHQLRLYLEGPMAYRVRDHYQEPFNAGATLVVLEDA